MISPTSAHLTTSAVPFITEVASIPRILKHGPEGCRTPRHGKGRGADLEREACTGEGREAWKSQMCKCGAQDRGTDWQGPDCQEPRRPGLVFKEWVSLKPKPSQKPLGGAAASAGARQDSCGQRKWDSTKGADGIGAAWRDTACLKGFSSPLGLRDDKREERIRTQRRAPWEVRLI